MAHPKPLIELLVAATLQSLAAGATKVSQMFRDGPLDH